MSGMSTDDFYTRTATRPRRASARAKVIDQDGREVPADQLGSDPFGNGGKLFHGPGP